MKKIIQISSFIGLLGFSGLSQAALMNVASVQFSASSLTKATKKLYLSEVVLAQQGSGNDLALTTAGAIASGTAKQSQKKANYVIDGIIPKKGKRAYYFKANKNTLPTLTIKLAQLGNIDTLNVFGKLKLKKSKNYLGVRFLDIKGNTIYQIKNLKKGLRKNKYKPLSLPNRVGATLSSVPIPASVWLFISGLVGVAAVARRKKHKSAG